MRGRPAADSTLTITLCDTSKMMITAALVAGSPPTFAW